MRLTVIIIFAGVCLGGAQPAAIGAPAQFWLSQSSTNPGIPSAPPPIDAAMGRQHTLYIWAKPATNTSGAIRELESFSLDIVSLDTSLETEAAPFIDFVDGTYKVENPTVAGENRFQFTADSFRDQAQGGPLTSELPPEEITEFTPDALEGLLGVSPYASPGVVGIGHASDPLCYPVGNCSAWRVGQLSFEVLQPSGVNDLFLQIGFQGMRHVGDGTGNPVLNTQVQFGGSSQTYDAQNPDHRRTTMGVDTFDVRINARPFSPGDFNGNGSVGPEDYNAWKSSFGQSYQAGGDGVDDSRNGFADAADYVIWRKLDALSGASPAAAVVPEPAAISCGAFFVLLMGVTSRSKARDNDLS
jgi:hypothetical protein